MRAAIGCLLLLCACSPSAQSAALCPSFSSGAKFPNASSYDQLVDNASQCELYWLTRFAPLPGPASDAVDASMAECRMQRSAAWQRGQAEGQVTDTEAAFIRQERDALLAIAMERRYHECPAVPLPQS